MYKSSSVEVIHTYFKKTPKMFQAVYYVIQAEHAWKDSVIREKK